MTIDVQKAWHRALGVHGEIYLPSAGHSRPLSGGGGDLWVRAVEDYLNPVHHPHEWRHVHLVNLAPLYELARRGTMGLWDLG